MANPNISAATSIVAGFNYGLMADTNLNEVLENAASSGTVIKINSIVIANADGTNAANVSMTISDASGGSDVHLAYQIQVPAKTNLVLVSADMRIYLLENKAVNLQASAANDLSYAISYEVIS